MATQNDFEARRRERRRREQMRMRRMRTFGVLVILIAVIVVVVVSSASRKNKENINNNAETVTAENTDAQPVDAEQPADGEQTAEGETAAPADPDDMLPLTVTELLRESTNIPEPDEENNLLQIIADSGEKKHCYLTFDDGPTENITPQVLDVLRRYNVKATFFQVGSLINANPDMARRVYEEGHLLANHSYSHNYDKLYATEESFTNEIEKTEEAIRSVSDGEEPFKLIRFPGGSYNSGDHASEKQTYKKTLQRMGYYYCDWNSLTGDAEGKTKNAEELLEYLKDNAEGYNNLIVLMHDASTKQATADALPSVIEYLAGEGYTFHRLDDIDYQTAAEDEEDTGSTEDEDESL